MQFAFPIWCIQALQMRTDKGRIFLFRCAIGTASVHPPYPRFRTYAIERMTAELDSGALTVVASPS